MNSEWLDKNFYFQNCYFFPYCFICFIKIQNAWSYLLRLPNLMLPWYIHLHQPSPLLKCRYHHFLCCNTGKKKPLLIKKSRDNTSKHHFTVQSNKFSKFSRVPKIPIEDIYDFGFPIWCYLQTSSSRIYARICKTATSSCNSLK